MAGGGGKTFGRANASRCLSAHQTGCGSRRCDMAEAAFRFAWPDHDEPAADFGPEMEFRVAVPKREPQRAESHGNVVPPDEANTIHDPVFRLLYKASRKRSTA